MHAKSRLKYVIIGGDYSQQEPRLLTHLCRDPKLIETYNNKKDLYATIAAAVFKKDYWECMEHWEDGSPNPVGKSIRSKAKGLVLGIMYGMGAKLMSSILGVTIEECTDILKEFFEMFPTIKEFTEGNERLARENGYVEDYMGRRRHLPDSQLDEVDIEANQKAFIDNVFLEDLPVSLDVYDDENTKKWKNIYKEQYADKGFKKKTEFKEKAKANNINVLDNGAFISRTMTQCTNARIQGSASTLTKKAMLNIFNDKEINKLGFRILIPVHDELLGECPIENAEVCEKKLAELMISASKPECSVDMKVDTYCVSHWYSDEVANSIQNDYVSYIKGNEKKGIEPISEVDAFNKLHDKYPELSLNTLRQMCDGTFDHLNGEL